MTSIAATTISLSQRECRSIEANATAAATPITSTALPSAVTGDRPHPSRLGAKPRLASDQWFRSHLPEALTYERVGLPTGRRCDDDWCVAETHQAMPSRHRLLW